MSWVVVVVVGSLSGDDEVLVRRSKLLMWEKLSGLARDLARFQPRAMNTREPTSINVK